MNIVELKENTSFYEELYNSKSEQVKMLKSQLESKKQDTTNKHLQKEKISEIRRFLEDETFLSRNIINMHYTYIIVINAHELIFVNDDKVPSSITQKKLNKIHSSENYITKSIIINEEEINYTIVYLEGENDE